MIEFLRSFRINYMLYNYFNRKLLIHNDLVYKKLGVKKNYYSSISSKHFSKFESLLPEFSSTTEIEKTKVYRESDDFQKEKLKSYNENGFVILSRFFDSKVIDSINLEVETLVEQRKIKPNYRNRIMFAFRKSNALRIAAANERLLELLHVLIGGKAILIQSINFEFGTEQPTYYDMIHMSICPLSGLIGVWVALEDITLDNGPLRY